MMANNLGKVEVLSHLLAFTHGSRTSYEKRTLTNHDAVAFIVWSLGPTKMRDIVDMMMVWRKGEATYTKTATFDWKTKRRGTRKVPAMGFDYLFNDSVYGGYGFIASRWDSPGNWMYSTEFTTGKVRSAKDGGPRFSKEEGVCNFFRRTYWYRAAKGTYAPTLECAKRMSEIGHYFDIQVLLRALTANAA